MHILITGGNSGLGLELVKFYLSRGDKVFTFSRSITNLKKLNHSNLLYSSIDINNKNEVVNFINHIDKLDALILNAGIHGEINKFRDSNFYQWLRAIETNFIGNSFVLRLSLSILEMSDIKPKVVVISGGGVTGARENYSSYSISKIALVKLVEVVSKENPNIDINAVSPGRMDTKLYRETGEQLPEGNTFTKPIELIDYLTSQESNGTTGKMISAVWDDWKSNKEFIKEDKLIYTLQRNIEGEQ